MRGAVGVADSAHASQAPVPVLRIEPSKGWVPLKLRELWEYRELLYFLTWRDIKVRYKQSVMGIAWAIIQPFVAMVVFTIFFGKLANLGPEGIPYPIWNYAAMVVWTYFAFALTQSSNSLVGSSSLLKKIYFPRLVVPIAATLSGSSLSAITIGSCRRWPLGTRPARNSVSLSRLRPAIAQLRSPPMPYCSSRYSTTSPPVNPVAPQMTRSNSFSAMAPSFSLATL